MSQNWMANMLALLNNWLFLACLSAVATALLIVLSSSVLGGIHSSAVMLIRVAGVLALVMPIFFIALNRGELGAQVLSTELGFVVRLVLVGVFAGISWYSFYLALEVGRNAGKSDALTTAINYSSVVLILLINAAIGRQDADWRNLVGCVLIVAGVFLTGLTPAGPANDEEIDKVMR